MVEFISLAVKFMGDETYKYMINILHDFDPDTWDTCCTIYKTYHTFMYLYMHSYFVVLSSLSISIVGEVNSLTPSLNNYVWA